MASPDTIEYSPKRKALIFISLKLPISKTIFVKLQVLGLRLGVDFTFTWNNYDNNDNNHNDNNYNNPNLNFFKGTVLGVKEGLGIRDKR